MGIALAVVGILGLVAALVLGVVALARRVRSRPARRTGLGAGGLAAGGLVLLIVGGAVLSSGSTTANTDQAADTTTTSPNPAASSTPLVPSMPATATTPPPASPAATTAAAPTPPPPAPTSPRAAAQPAPPTTTATARPARAAAGPAAAAAAALTVKGRAPKTGYTRQAFGPAWTDQVGVPGGHNGCDTRNDVLRRDLTGIQVVAGTGGCQVAAGTLPDPYSGTRITFTRGASTSTAVQIDHVVALSDAWQTGAFAWTPDKREQFANDPLNLLAVQGTLNEAKGDGDAATWLPPNKAERCAYIARQVAVKTTYSLWVTPAEQQASQRVLTGCPDQALPTETSSTPPDPDPAPGAPVLTAPQPTTSPSPAPLRPTAGPTTAAGVYYANCAAVRAAGKAPLYRGQPGYRAALDGDGNGVACQTQTSGGGGSGTGGGGSVTYKNCAAVKAAGKAPLRRGQPGYSRKLDRDGDGIACEK